MEKGIEIDLYRLSSNPDFTNRVKQLRLKLFSQINEIVFYGKGGYDFNTIYTMPVWLRRFTYREILAAYEREAAAVKSASEGKETRSLSKPPNLRVPDYSIKGPSK